MDAYSIILSLLRSDKANIDVKTKNVYTFYISKRANKTDVKNAIKKIFGVTPQKINLCNKVGTPKKKKGISGITSSKKKVYVKFPQNSVNMSNI